MNISSTSSSSSSSLGNTSMAGFGGLVSGLDRDALIEQLTSSTSSKITAKEQAITKSEWKQTAYREITDKVLTLEDDYLMMSSSKSLKNADLYEKSVLTTQGDETAKGLISASGASDLSEYITIRGVKQTASSATVISAVKGGATSITTNSLKNSDGTTEISTSNLQGKELEFGVVTGVSDNRKFSVMSTFTFPESYKDADGETVTIDYTNKDKKELVSQLNEAVRKSNLDLGDDVKTSEESFEMFAYDEETDSISLNLGKSTYNIKSNSTALAALGVDKSKLTGSDLSTNGITVDAFNENTKEAGNFSEASVKTSSSVMDYFADKKMSVTYGGETQSITLVTSEQAAAVKNSDMTDDEKLEALRSTISTNINKAFGSGKVNVTLTDDGALSFAAADGTTSLELSVSDSELRKNLGLSETASNKMTMTASLLSNRDKLGLTNEVLGLDASETDEETIKAALNDKLENFSINGQKISGLTADTSVNKLVTAINKSDANVRATYMSGTNQFVLVATETGTGREITFDDDVSSAIFGGEGAVSKDGQDAVMTFDYGNGAVQTVTSSTNTFNIDGMSIKVSGTFGYTESTDAEGNTVQTLDGTTGVTFQASANVDKVTERVKSFVESFNEIVKAVNDQVRTRPDSSYEPLTDAQKEEMTEKQIEEWEEKAKSGILYNESTIRDFSSSLQTVFSKILGQGYNYKDFEEIGLTFSDDYSDGGKIVFDEDKFKAAMENNPELVSEIMAGDGNEKKGLVSTVEDILTPYATRFATRNGNSYGRLVEEAGTSQLPLSEKNNLIYKSIKEMNDQITTLKALLKTEQERYTTQFTSLESTISDLNSQAYYIESMSM